MQTARVSGLCPKPIRSCGWQFACRKWRRRWREVIDALIGGDHNSIAHLEIDLRRLVPHVGVACNRPDRQDIGRPRSRGAGFKDRHVGNPVRILEGDD